MFVTSNVIHLGWQEGAYQEVDISKAEVDISKAFTGL